MNNMSTQKIIILICAAGCIGLVTWHLMQKQAPNTTPLNSEIVTVVDAVVPVEQKQEHVQPGKPEKTAQQLQEITTKASLDELLSNTDKPVIVKFFATWCPPCRALKPAYQASADGLSHRAYFAEIDIDKFDDKDALTNTYSIQSFPTIVFFKNGNEVKRIQAINNKSHIQQELDAL